LVSCTWYGSTRNPIAGNILKITSQRRGKLRELEMDTRDEVVDDKMEIKIKEEQLKKKKKKKKKRSK
jgi:hypothetical protein